jgi:signal transduction histidine kinase
LGEVARKVAIGRLLETVAAFVPRRITPARRAPRATAGVISHYASQLRVDRFIAGTRLAFTLCALLAIIVDPSEPAQSAPHVLGLAVAYAFYSLTTMGWAWSSTTSLSKRARLGTQVIDIGVAVVLMCLSGGTSSPFFSFMVFPLLSASLRWRWRGALWTGGSSLAAYVGVAFYTVLGGGSAAVALNSLIIEGVYLVIVTLVLAYLAVHDDRVRKQMGRVATWTISETGESDGHLCDVLGHAAAVVDAPRALLVWQAADEPRVTLALWTPAQFHVTSEASASFEPLVAEPLEESDFVCGDAERSDARVICMAGNVSWRWRGRPLGDGLRLAFAIRDVIAVRLDHGSLRGRLFILDKPSPNSDDLVLATVVARQVENVLVQDYLARRLQEAALAHERARVARDVHDGALQSLAGAAIRLAMIRRQLEEDPTGALDALRELQTLIMLQQRELRSFVHQLQTGGCAANSGLADLLTELVLRIEQEWKLAVKLDVKLQTGHLDASLPPELVREIHQLIREALVNAARHARASLVHVTIELDGDWVRITVADNGQGFPFRGRLEHDELAERNLGPAMLQQRIAALGGMLAIESSEAGARLQINLPRHRRTDAVDPAGVRAASRSVGLRPGRLPQ